MKTHKPLILATALLVSIAFLCMGQTTIITFLRQLRDVRLPASASIGASDGLIWNTNGYWTNGVVGSGGSVTGSYAFNAGQFTLTGTTNVNLASGVAVTNLSERGTLTAGALTVTNRLRSIQTALSYSTTNVTVDTSLANVFFLTLTNPTTYLPQPTNLVSGHSFMIHVMQDGTGGRALAYDTNFWRFSSNSIPTISTNANAWDILACVVGPHGTNVAIVHTPRFR
jgi:hypothetical protein